MENIKVPLDDIIIVQILTNENINITFDVLDNKEIFKKWFIKKYKKRIIKRVKIRKKLLQKN
tara:strand:+ start:65 stop:250 length:186 start_codon:yes stop_codon:yes gene_type:complete